MQSHLSSIRMPLRIHLGLLWMKQRAIAAEAVQRGTPIIEVTNGTAKYMHTTTDMALHQQATYASSSRDIAHCCAIAVISLSFPSIMHCNWSWTKVKRALTNDKLRDVIRVYQSELTE